MDTPQNKNLAVIALGANIGEPLSQLDETIARLKDVIEVEQVSPIYRTRPVGEVDQPDFLNLVVVGSTLLEPLALLHQLQVIEHELGRERAIYQGPRKIDCDLILCGNTVIESGVLALPHPRYHERDFVLQPLADIDPWIRDPKSGKTVQDMLLEVRERSILACVRQGTVSSKRGPASVQALKP